VPQRCSDVTQFRLKLRHRRRLRLWRIRHG
jgi:hypothetical protein